MVVLEIFIIIISLSKLFMSQAQDLQSQIFNSKNLSVRERITDWCPEFRKTVGSRVSGKYAGHWIKPAEGMYKEQLYIAIENADNNAMVSAVQLPSYRLNEVLGYDLGDLIGVEYAGEKPAKVKGMNPTKVINVYNGAYQNRVATGNVSVSAKNVETTTDNDPIEYPSDYINPEDIPF
jgi:hypothetical protein